MNATPMPTPKTPTPQLAPTVAGIFQAALMSYLITHAGTAAGLDQNTALVIAGVVVSLITSGFHRIAQSLHWSL